MEDELPHELLLTAKLTKLYLELSNTQISKKNSIRAF